MLLRPFSGIRARLLAAAASDAPGLRQAFAALSVSTAADLVAGLTLGAMTGTLDALPGLLVLVPAAIGMRGNIFGALGSRLGTAIHTGTFRLSGRRDTVVGQNLFASIALTFAISGALAVLAKALATTFGVADTISLLDFFVISVVGGVISSAVVLGLTLAVADQSAKRGWDLDNVAAPLVTAAGDMVTLPALFLATYLVGLGGITDAIGVACIVAAVLALVLGLRTSHGLLQRIMRESLPVLCIAGAVDVVAGLTIEHQLESFLAYPALLVLVPPFVQEAGALGGILSSRLGSKLHLGTIEPTSRPQRAARDDFLLIVILAVPIFVLVAVLVELASLVFGYSSPGPLQLIGASLIGGMIATTVALFVAYYGAIVTYRLGLDPDNYGIPMMTSSMDLVGAVGLILGLTVVGVG
jgi:mgtE-like transporter